MKNLIICAALVLLSCDQNEFRRNTSKEMMSQTIYVRDTRTNLCFATWLAGSSAGSLTNVPCSPEVVAKLINPAKKQQLIGDAKARCESIGMYYGCFRSESGDGPCFCVDDSNKEGIDDANQDD